MALLEFFLLFDLNVAYTGTFITIYLATRLKCRWFVMLCLADLAHRDFRNLMHLRYDPIICNHKCILYSWFFFFFLVKICFLIFCSRSESTMRISFCFSQGVDGNNDVKLFNELTLKKRKSKLKSACISS